MLLEAGDDVEELKTKLGAFLYQLRIAADVSVIPLVRFVTLRPSFIVLCLVCQSRWFALLRFITSRVVLPGGQRHLGVRRRADAAHAEASGKRGTGTQEAHGVGIKTQIGK